MRRVVVCGLLLLLGLCRWAFATDYDLTVDPGSKGLLKEHSLTIYQPFGLVKAGDRIVSLNVGPLPSPNIACRVWAGVGRDSVVLVPKGTMRHFHGEIRLGKGDPGSDSVGAALLMHVTPAGSPDEGASVLQSAGSFIGGHPVVLILPAILIVIGVVVALLRINTPAPGTAPLYGKKAYEENVREVKEKLERIMEAQEGLVRKPPVLRSFRKQIDRFDKRLEKLEVTSVSSQQALSVIASSVVDLQKYLDELSARNEVAKESIDVLHSGLANHSEEVRKSTASIREDLHGQAAKFKESIAELAGQVGSQMQHVETLAKSLKEEVRVQVDGIGQATSELGARLDKQSEQNATQASSVSADFARMHERLAEGEKAVAGLGQSLSAEEKSNADRAERVQQSFSAVLEQFQGLSPLPANVSELHGRVGNLKADLNTLSEKLVASSAEMGDLQRTNLVSFAELEEQVSSLKGALGDIGQELSKLQTEVNASRSVGEANSATLADVAKVVDSVRETAVTRDQVEKLHAGIDTSRTVNEANSVTLAAMAKSVDAVKEVAATREQVAKFAEMPAAIETLRSSLDSVDSRLAQVGLTKEDGQRILKAHEKLTALSGDVSLAIQKVLEQKLAALMAQTLVPKKGKESEGSGISDRGAAALTEVAQQLLAGMEHQKNLENTLAEVLAKIEEVPTALEKIDEKLAQTPTKVEVPAPIPVQEMMSLIAETKEAVSGVPSRIEGIEKGLGEVAAKWDQTSDKIERAAQQVVDIANAPRIETVVYRPAVVKAEIEAELPPVPAAAQETPVQAKQPKVADVEPAVMEPAVEDGIGEPLTETPVPIEALESEPAPAPAVPDELAAEHEGEIHLSVSASEPETTIQPAVPQAPAIKRAAAAEWVASTGNYRGTYSTETPKQLTLVSDPEAAKRPLTPTETPGIEYQIGPMLCARSKVIYVHGDSLHVFWPGGNERSILLSHPVPEDTWRLFLMDQRIFCAQEKRVEIIDTGNWTKSAFFTGQYLGQCGFSGLWAGVRGGPMPVLDFRNQEGELVGKAIDLESSFNELLPMVSNDKAVWLASESGQIFKVQPGKGELFCDLASGKQGLHHFLLTDFGPVAITDGPAGLSIKLLDAKGKVAKTAVSDANQISGNVVALGNHLYFFDPDRAELAVCDLEEMRILSPIELPAVQRVRRMVGFGSGSSEVLMIAASDAGGKLGSVFLLDSLTERQVLLCSTNQPHVDAVFGEGHAIVATSSSYQNIIRVFQPFENAEESGRAA